MRRWRRRRWADDRLTSLALAFALGLFVALFCSMRLLVIVTVLFLFCMGWKDRC